TNSSESMPICLSKTVKCFPKSASVTCTETGKFQSDGGFGGTRMFTLCPNAKSADKTSVRQRRRLGFILIDVSHLVSCPRPTLVFLVICCDSLLAPSIDKNFFLASLSP